MGEIHSALTWTMNLTPLLPGMIVPGQRRPRESQQRRYHWCLVRLEKAALEWHKLVPVIVPRLDLELQISNRGDMHDMASCWLLHNFLRQSSTLSLHQWRMMRSHRWQFLSRVEKRVWNWPFFLVELFNKAQVQWKARRSNSTAEYFCG